jgi:hypothetical protein
VRGVLNHLELITIRQSPDSGHVTHLAAIMHRHDRGNLLAGFQSRLNLPLGVRHIHIVVVLAAIHQYGPCPQITDDLGGGRKSHGGHDYPLPRAKPNRLQCEVQGGGAGIEGDRVRLADIGRELALEPLDLRTGRKPPALQRVHDLVNFIRADAGLVKWDFLHGSQIRPQLRVPACHLAQPDNLHQVRPNFKFENAGAGI